MNYGKLRKIMKFFLVCAFVFTINPQGASAADYFVSTTGNDSNPGTIGNPFRTLEKAANVMSSGDTMYIRAGTYKRGSEILNLPSGGGSWETSTTIKAYNKEEVIITPQDPTTITGTDTFRFPNGRSWIIFEGIIVDGGNINGGAGGSNGFRLSWNGHHFRLKDVEIRYTARSAILTGNCHSNQFINVYAHHADNLIEGSSARPYGIYMESGNNLILGGEWSYNRGYGINLYSGHDFKPDNNLIIGAHVHHNNFSGMTVSSGSGNLVMNSVFHDNGTFATYPSSGVSPSFQEHRYGFQTWAGGSNNRFYNNTTYNNYRGGVILFHMNGVILKNNIFSEPGCQNAVIHIHSTSVNNIFEHNLIYHDNAGKLILDQSSGNTFTHNISGTVYDPKFVSPKNANFHLLVDSPAIGKGIVLKEVTHDFDNVQRKLEGPFDIGAFAFMGSSLKPPQNLVVIDGK